MIPNLSPNNPDTLPSLTDDGYPCFLNVTSESADEPGDWWLDLGRVDFPDGAGL